MSLEGFASLEGTHPQTSFCSAEIVRTIERANELGINFPPYTR